MGIFDSLFHGQKKLNIGIYDSDKEVPENMPYRLKNDPENLVRIWQDYIIDSEEKWDTLDEYWGLHVSGVTYREKSVLSFISGENRRVKLVSEPTSKHPHAIAVYGKWVNNNKQYEDQLGFIPDECAKEIYKRTRKVSQYLLSAKLNRMFVPTKDKNAGLMIDVILKEPRWPRFEIHGIGKKSGRKRKKTYRAKTFEEALKQAYADEMIVDLQACREII